MKFVLQIDFLTCPAGFEIPTIFQICNEIIPQEQVKKYISCLKDCTEPSLLK